MKCVLVVAWIACSFLTLLVAEGKEENEDLKTGVRALEFTINNITYIVYDEKVSQKEALTLCVNSGMNLIYFPTFEEWSSVYLYLRANDLIGIPFWTAGEEERDIGYWFWRVDGETLDWSSSFSAPWGATQPDSSIIPSCMFFYATSNGWADEACSYAYQYICKSLP